MKYDWKAIPETTWGAFAAALGGLVVAILVVYGVNAAITGATGLFIGSFFRLIVALLGAAVSDDGTVTTGTEEPPTP